MKYIDYIKLTGKDGLALKNCISNGGYKEQKAIVDYLKSEKENSVIFAVPGIPKDVLTGEIIEMYEYGMSDGVYTWSNILSYYVEKYNLRLPKDFEEHILSEIHA